MALPARNRWDKADITIRIVSDLAECAALWTHTEVQQTLFQLWEVRMCFQAEFGHRPHFVVAERDADVVGLLPLSWVPEENCYAFFPGELWHGKTWLERNRVWSADAHILTTLLGTLDAPTLIRYLEADSVPTGFAGAMEDEIGYLFYPPAWDFTFDVYSSAFPGKSWRKLQKEIGVLEADGVEVRQNHLEDVHRMFDMNLSAFGDYSYFSDPRFRRSFERLVRFLHDRDALLITTVLIGGRAAAIDLGAVWNNAYTVLAGGVDRSFPGVAKLINFHHLRHACAHRFDEVDFLCGDFGWKQRFRLTPRPLLKIEQGDMPFVRE